MQDVIDFATRLNYVDPANKVAWFTPHDGNTATAQSIHKCSQACKFNGATTASQNCPLMTVPSFAVYDWSATSIIGQPLKNHQEPHAYRITVFTGHDVSDVLTGFREIKPNLPLPPPLPFSKLFWAYQPSYHLFFLHRHATLTRHA